MDALELLSKSLSFSWYLENKLKWLRELSHSILIKYKSNQVKVNLPLILHFRLNFGVLNQLLKHLIVYEGFIGWKRKKQRFGPYIKLSFICSQKKVEKALKTTFPHDINIFTNFCKNRVENDIQKWVSLRHKKPPKIWKKEKSFRTTSFCFCFCNLPKFSFLILS